MLKITRSADLPMFCRHCGALLTQEARFCPGCGAQIPVRQAMPARAMNPNSAAKAPLKKRIMDYLMIPIAIILILLGIGQMALAVAGRPVTAQVTGCEQVLFLNNDESTRNPSRYKLGYQFFVNGERYDGTVTRVFAGGSQMRETLPVRYLPFWPHVSAEDDNLRVALAGPALVGLGVLVFGLAVRKKPRRRKNA